MNAPIAWPFRCWFVSMLLPATLLPAAADPLQAIEKSATEWLKVRSETTRLESAWTLERPILQGTVTATTERAAGLEEKREQLRLKTVEEREELAAITQKIEAGTADMSAVDGRLRELSARLQQLRPSLPPRLSEALDVSFRSLARPELAPGERMQLAMNVLNRCAQFNRMITCGEEAVHLEGEANARSLEVIYWGLSHAYALDRTQGRAWIGSPAGERWQWAPHPEAATGVARLIAIYHDKADPEFVTVPAQLKPTRAAAR